MQGRMAMARLKCRPRVLRRRWTPTDLQLDGRPLCEVREVQQSEHLSPGDYISRVSCAR